MKLENIIKQELRALKKQKLNEGLPQWVKDCCTKRKDRQCCDLVDDNKDGKEIPKDVLNNLKSLKESDCGCNNQLIKTIRESIIKAQINKLT